MMDARTGGIDRGEFHAWVAGPRNDRTKGPIKITDEQYIDFSSRHYRRYVGVAGRTRR
jgi:hypothetical protein